MSRKTPTLELMQNVDIASPVRRSSRIAQNQKSSAPIVTRRASADTKTTTAISESRKSRRLSLTQEPSENSESGRSTPVFTNNECKTPSTMKRKDSTSNLNDGKTVTPVKRTSTPLTRRSTRSMSRSPQKSEEITESSTKSRSRYYSMTEKLKPLEAIKEMEIVKESLQHEKENDERDKCDTKVEFKSRNLDKVKEAIVILNPIIKDSCLMNLNVSDEQFETQGSLKKDANINVTSEHGNNVILEENGINETDIQKSKVMMCNSENNEIKKNEILETSITEKIENDAEDKLIENKNSPESVIIKTAEENNCTHSIKTLETTLSNSKDSTCELVLSNNSHIKNINFDSNASFSEDQSFQFNLNISIDKALKTSEKKGKETKINTRSCKDNEENESSMSSTSNLEVNSRETPKSIVTKLNKAQEQSPKCDKSPVEIEIGTSIKKVWLCEPMDVDDDTLVEYLDDNIALQVPIKSPKQLNKNVYLTSPEKNEKCMQNIDNTIKGDAGIGKTTGDEEDQQETEMFNENKPIIQEETTENVQFEDEILNQGDLRIIPVETPTESSNGQISEIETEVEKEKNHSTELITTIVVNKKLDKTDEVYASKDGQNYNFKNNEKNEKLRKSISAENISIDKEKDNLNSNDDNGEKIRHISPTKHETMKKIAHQHITSPQLNIDVELDNKVTDLITKTFNVNQEKSDSEVDVQSVTDYLDNMAEEGEGDDESENISNEIPDEGESVGYSSSDEKETDDDSFDDSFIDDDLSSELLSGKEYDLDDEKTENRKNNKKSDETKEEIECKRLQKGKEKWSRIIQADESDESLSEISKIDATNSVSMLNTKEQGLHEQTTKRTIVMDDEQVIECNSALNKSLDLQSSEANKLKVNITSEQADETETSPKKTKKRSSLTISENLSFDEIRERIEQVVDLFSSTVNKSNRKIYLNLSLNYESDCDSREDESKLSTSLQIDNASNKLKKSRRKLSNSSNIFTYNTKPTELQLSINNDGSLTKEKYQNEVTELKDSIVCVNDFQPCKSDEIIDETLGSNKKKRRIKNIEEETLLLSLNKKNKFCEENENIKSTEKIFNDNLVILNPPKKKKKKVECSEETVVFLDNNKFSFDEDFEIRKKIKKRKHNETNDQENSETQFQLINEFSPNEGDIIMNKKGKKRKTKKAGNTDKNNLKNDIIEVDSSSKKKKEASDYTRTGDIRKNDNVKILSNVLINNANEKSVYHIKTLNKKHEINFTVDNQPGVNIEDNIKLDVSTKKKKDKNNMKKNKTEKSTNTLLNIIPSKSNSKLWIVDNFDTPPRPSQNRKLKFKKKNNPEGFAVPAEKDFKTTILYDSSRINRMETTQLLKKKKKQFEIKSV